MDGPWPNGPDLRSFDVTDVFDSAARALVIEPARPEDLPAIIAIFAADSLGGHGDTTDPAALPRYRAAFEAIAASNSTDLYVGRLDGRVVATYQLLFAHGIAGRGAGRAIIEGVQVEAGLRGQGIGAAMVAHAEAEARARGAATLALTSNAARIDAHRFYERLGFAKTHVGFKKPL
jgi:GNAT superfamily N-acetyltransferase